MPTIDCKALLDTCTMRVYADNGFRILDAPVDISPRRLKRRSDELQAAIDTGELEEEYSRFFRPHPLPTAETIRHAGHQLQDPLLRFVHEFFWFRPMEWGKSASDEGLLALKAGGAKQAREVWVRVNRKGVREQAFVARHNLAVLWHLTALDGEMRFLRNGDDTETIPQDQEKRINSCWQQAVKYWEALCASETYWSFLADHVRSTGDPRLTTGFVRRFRDTLPIAFDNINADIAAEMARQRRYKRAAIHIKIMRHTNAGSDDLAASIRRITGPLHDRIDHAVSQATRDIQSNKREGIARMNHLVKATWEPLRVLSTLLTAKDPEFVETADQVAEAMLVCQVAYGNETEDWDKSEVALETALKLAHGPKLKERIEENLETVRGNKKLSACWFCGQSRVHDDSAAEVKMHKVVHLKNLLGGDKTIIQDVAGLSQADREKAGQALLMGGDPTLTRTASLKVPRCSSCKAVHQLGEALFGGIAVPGGILAIVIGVLAYDGWGAFGASICGIAIMVLLGWVAQMIYLRSQGTRREGDNRRFPPIKQLLAEGWSFGTPPTSAS